MSYIGTTPQFQSLVIDDIEIDGDIIYFGDKDTDGSFRIRKDGANYKVQVRASGVWTDKDIINP